MSQTTLFEGLQQEKTVKISGPVTCLGQTFASDEERRKHFTELLREKLQDPEFRKIEGFPHGETEDILNLSDPPYYTACPNPWLADFITEWEAQKPVLSGVEGAAQPEDYHYHREPFAADVSEGKNAPIYNAHSYHTKVPHKAIMRYILHYTNPGDIVFDGFCGTGMTGVAAQLCGDKNVVMELGYQVKPDGSILQEETDSDGKKVWLPFSKLGVRRAVLNDLSPAATFIAYNYNTPVDVVAFEQEAKRILQEVEQECGWMYETLHSDGKEPVPEQIHAYLSSNWKELRNLPKDDATLKAKASDRWYVPDPNKAGDLEKLREKALLKEFDHYKEAKKKLKIFRLEAVRAGFKKSWQDRDYATIINVAEKIPSNILEEDPKLLMWYDQAVTRMGD